jgi:hypothetical protein
MKKLLFVLLLLVGCDETQEERAQRISHEMDLIKLRPIPGTGCDLYYASTHGSSSGPVVVCPTEGHTSSETNVPRFGEFNLKLR